MKRSTLWLWRLVVAAVAFAAALTLVEPAAWRVASDHPEWLLPALGGWLANQWFCAVRFFVLANRAGVPLPFMQSLRMTLVANFVGCIFGGFAATDVARAIWLRQADTGAGLSGILVLLVLDRGLGLLAFAVWAFALSYAVPATLVAGADVLIETIRALCAGFVAAVVVVAVLATLFARSTATEGTGIIARISRIVGFAVQPRIAVGMLLAFPLALLSAGTVIVAQGWMGTQIMDALGSSPQFLLQSFLAPASIIVSILPLVPLGIGLGQLTLSGLYALCGLALDAAVILTTLMQVGQLAIAVGFGAPVLAMVRRTRRD